jgi:hypothetical protein
LSGRASISVRKEAANVKIFADTTALNCLISCLSLINLILVYNSFEQIRASLSVCQSRLGKQLQISSSNDLTKKL